MSNSKNLPEATDLLAARVYLRLRDGAWHGRHMPAWLGSAAQDLFVRALDGCEENDMGLLHDDGGQARPYTASTLQPISAYADRRWNAHKEYFLRFTTLKRATSAALLRAASTGGALCPGPESRVEFCRAPFRVTRVDFVQRRDTGYLNYADLRGHFQRMGRPPTQIKLNFACETAFPLAGARLSLPLPLASKVFSGLLRKWNQFWPVERLELPPAEELDACLALAEFRIQSGMVHLENVTGDFPGERRGVKRKGFKGEVVYEIYGGDETLARAANTLAEYAFFAGVGMETTRGMGQAFRLPLEEGGKEHAG